MFQYDEPQHLNGKWMDRAKKGARAVADAGKAAGSAAKQTYNAGVAHYHAGVAKYHERLHPNQPATDVRKMSSAIDICECSRRVQGHLAIQYPEFH